MEELAVAPGSGYETPVFLEYFEDFPDPRQRGKVMYPLDEMLLLALLAVLAGAETFVKIAWFGAKKLPFLRRFRPFLGGTPSHDHLGDIFASLDAGQFQRCFVAWVSGLSGTPAEVIAIDGKTSRRSKGANAAIHMVSAFAARQRLVLGQVKVAEKSNETLAIPKLLNRLAIEGAIVTIDAMGCQRDIAQKIIDKKADYVLALTGNQGRLRKDVELFAAEQMARGFADSTISQGETVDSDQGRIETRKTTTIRSHRAIENSLHGVIDMVFRDDECRVRTKHAPANFATIKHMAHNLIRKAPSKDSPRHKRKVAACDDDLLASII